MTKLPGLLEEIQNLILDNPERGDVVAGTGGIRKMRISNPNRAKGKRGGFRVLYLDLSDKGRTHLMLLIDKGSVEDITPDEKKILHPVVRGIKAEGRTKP